MMFTRAERTRGPYLASFHDGCLDIGGQPVGCALLASGHQVGARRSCPQLIFLVVFQLGCCLPVRLPPSSRQRQRLLFFGAASTLGSPRFVGEQSERECSEGTLPSPCVSSRVCYPDAFTRNFLERW